MARAALRLLGFLLGAAGLHAAAPAPLASVRIGKIEYVRATDVAARLGLGLKWQGSNRLELIDAAGRIEVPAPGSANFREITVNGLKVWLGDPAVARSGQVYFSRIDFEDRLIPLLQPRSGSPAPSRPHIIALDPGHGGTDHGTNNSRLGYMEKTFTLEIGLRLKKLLEAHGYEVVMTRTNDSRFANDPEVDLPLRAKFANTKHADLFLSIHFNAGATAADSTSHGTEVFTFAPDHQRSTAHWADTDDSEPNAKHHSPAPVLRFNHWNVVFARAMHAVMHRQLGTEGRGERIAHWGVLRELDCPGILIESAFITNDAEARRVATPAFQQQIAEAMLDGINAYAAEIDALRPPIPARTPTPPLPGSAPAAPAPKTLSPPQRPS